MLDRLSAAVRMAQRVRLVLVEAPVGLGVPRIACARTLAPLQGSVVALAGWFAPEVASHLRGSSALAIVVWDQATGSGFEITGTTESLQEYGECSAFDLGSARGRPTRAEAELRVRVEKIVAFGAEEALTAGA